MNSHTPAASPAGSFPRRFRFARSVLAVSMLVMGGCGIIYEYVLGVLGNNLMGSSHEQIFVVIGIMMFSMGIGAVMQRRIHGALVDWFLLIELALGLVGGASVIIIYAAFVYTISYQAVLYGFAFAIGALIGLEVPLLIRINAEYSHSLRANLSDILCMDYVGALFGALIFTYVLITRLSIGQMGFAVGCVNALLAVGGMIYFWPLTRRRTALVVLALAVVIPLPIGLANVNGWIAGLEQRCFDDPIVYQTTTKYQHLVLTRRNDHLRLYINGHLQFSSRDEAVYHELLVHTPMVVAARRQRVLILGGGDGLALREVAKYPGAREITLVDIDPGMIELAAEQADMVDLNNAAFHDARVFASASPGVQPGERIVVTHPTKLAPTGIDDAEYDVAGVQVFTVDADQFIQEAGGQYDVVIIDFPDPRSLELAKLYSVDFYRSLRQHLAPGAVIAVQSTSPRRARFVFLCIGESLRAAGFRTLPYQQYLTSFGDWGWHLAWMGPMDESQMRRRLAAVDGFDVPTAFITPELMNAAFVFGKGTLAAEPPIRPNTKIRPSIVAYYRQGFRE